MAESLPESTNDSVEAKEELMDECESIWNQMEECQKKLTCLRMKTPLKSDERISLQLRKVQMKALTEECNQWQNRSPEIISTNPDVLVALGKEELKKVKDDLEMVLSTVQSKNKQLEEELKREQQWHDEQEQILNTLSEIEEDRRTQIQHQRKKRSVQELQNKELKLKRYKQNLLDRLCEFLQEHFPVPESGGSNKKKSSEEPSVKLVSLSEILEVLINKLVKTPHEPYVKISDSFWPPYIELLLRYGIALRHPEDPYRIRLEAFHM
ncbi:centromere protein K isoform X2 [Tyto alba]|uniref:centromere protein K isoform X2 n=1 Tax=Tyto alba TaxID=56313 RepID=UPI001403A307|nr:centromere protein K isoform X2 [Tyto alba]